MNMDVLITFLIIVAIVGWEYLKIKKKMASEAQKAAARKRKYDIEKEYLEEDDSGGDFVWENEKFESDSSKSESYFTYETVSEPEVKGTDTSPSTSSKLGENHLQEVENETETNGLDLHNPEELRKAILYGEILKNPYN